MDSRVLVLGPAPLDGEFRAAFLVTTAAPAAGVALAARNVNRRTAQRGVNSSPTGAVRPMG
ncbi:MAG: hypothetical protein GEV28_01540 [Actinophytocola sp.]|uniref:hypothetical protein n=1 Tax=Actinophytocola sp. TaxID=1872138 RepID=UPI001320C455|nr:hypothetical protein [Actinophytocola sp.]MPZ79138.1 hypothetical protein [Actinophytocola sp.]